MPISHHLLDQIQKIDQQIINLLEQRVKYCQEAAEEDERALSPEYLMEFMEEWNAAAEEKGWNIGIMNRIGKGVNELCRSAGE
ncbi:MAG: hypothetical protein Greene041619_897 [Candidatus Peregrinibacteria bacterium Greene0416_19]|nr:MAG: hypothetical protein Greene041619_897 [Candidatus Peregrinibacteria bacterium Greene0416_19]